VLLLRSQYVQKNRQKYNIFDPMEFIKKCSDMYPRYVSRIHNGRVHSPAATDDVFVFFLKKSIRETT